MSRHVSNGMYTHFITYQSSIASSSVQVTHAQVSFKHVPTVFESNYEHVPVSLNSVVEVDAKSRLKFEPRIPTYYTFLRFKSPVMIWEISKSLNKGAVLRKCETSSLAGWTIPAFEKYSWKW
jgi:hypothetical protein